MRESGFSEGNIPVTPPVVKCLTRKGWDTSWPTDLRAASIRWVHKEVAAAEWIAKDVRHVVEDSCIGQGVSKVGLGGAVVESVVDGGELDGDTAALRVTAELLAVDVALVENLFGSDGAADRPQEDVEGAVVLDDSVADASDSSGGAEGGEDEGFELHFGLCLVAVFAWNGRFSSV
ncbi:hypothetical protein PRK78_003701 [Emydomyces testavorans]|uniref:Uncharacterized protein n=1 Tax=Emydomyces testavorans TaxID=2070801 RepID=A0AAF0DH98_9EURO|nr:hypothetical protein PRK78_003701 [Emydomyces testavorans]